MENICSMCTLIIPKGKNLCEACEKIKNDLNYSSYFAKPSIFEKDFEEYVNKTKRMIFAYSGGLDSTIVLHKLNKVCKEKNIDLQCFTIDHGYKGAVVKKNIDNVIKFEGLEKQHNWIDISNDIMAGEKPVKDYLGEFSINGILPCGKKCNAVIDGTYKKILDSLGEKVLVTGGDTPSRSTALNRYSILWEKPLFTVLRGGIAFGLTKKINRLLIKSEKIPWVMPDCGGADTDCLLPGATLRVLKEKGFDESFLFRNLEAAQDYYSVRVRWGIIERKEAFEELSKAPISGDFSFKEFKELSGYK